jgi:hypothetical protein
MRAEALDAAPAPAPARALGADEILRVEALKVHFPVTRESCSRARSGR